MEQEKVSPIQDESSALINTFLNGIYNWDWADQNSILFKLLDNFNDMRNAKVQEKHKDADYHSEQQKIFISTIKG